MSLQPQETERRAASSVLCGILARVADLLRADPAFAAPGTEIITEDKGDIDTAIAQAVAALGLCATVMLADARGAKESLPGPVFTSVGVVVEISENTLANRASGGRTALEAAEEAARLLHLARLPDGRTLTVTDLAKFPNPVEPADVCYHVIARLANVSLNRKVKTT
jgi:hypothetical protein